jgi:exopolysaccharide production protein ExoY
MNEAKALSIPFTGAPAFAAGRAVKRAGDLLGACAMLLFAAPLLLLIAGLVKAQDGGPVLFRHERIGRGGAPFLLWKFRTMTPDASVRLGELLIDPKARAEWTDVAKLRRDPRVTPLGRFLRRASFDELPQLLNVLRGEMSLVGPRPVTADELARYGSGTSAYEAMRPGLTGLWQVRGRNDLRFDDRVALDRAYVAGWSLTGDLGILARTVPAVLFGRGAC